MSRWVIAIALSWSAWVAVQPAAAHARPLLSSELGPAMCSDGSQTVSWEALAFGRAFSHGALAVSAAEDTSEQRATEEVDDDSTPAWCISPDDPRCAPRDQSAPLDGPRAHVPMQDVSAMQWPDFAAESGKDKLRPAQLGAARPGAELLVERPPRA